MEASIVTAVVTASIAAVASYLVAHLQHRNSLAILNEEFEKQRATREDESIQKDTEIYRRFREPFLNSAFDLQSRIFNLVDGDLIARHGAREGLERENIQSYTSFLICQIFAWIEIRRTEVQHLNVSETETNKGLDRKIEGLVATFATDYFDDGLFIFRGHQRAAAEQCLRRDGESLTCAGYAEFLERLAQDDFRFLRHVDDKVALALAKPELARKRLVEIQNRLIEIIWFLKPDEDRFPEDKLHRLVDQS